MDNEALVRALRKFEQNASHKPTGFSPWVRRANFSCMKNNSLLSMHLCG